MFVGYIVCLTSILVNIEDARLACLPLNFALRMQYLAMYYRSILEFRVELECNVCDTLTET